MGALKLQISEIHKSISVNTPTYYVYEVWEVHRIAYRSNRRANKCPNRRSLCIAYWISHAKHGKPTIRLLEQIAYWKVNGNAIVHWAACKEQRSTQYDWEVHRIAYSEAEKFHRRRTVA